MTTSDPPDFAALHAQVDRAVAGFIASMAAAGERLVRELNAGLGKIHRAIERAAEEFRRIFALPPLAPHLRRLLWTGIARRHADRPPTRGFWLRRCFCLPCRERKGLA